MRLTHLGHACLLVEVDGARLLLDPGTLSSGFEELTELDAVLITHQHADHVDVQRLPALLDANDGAVLVAEPQIAADLADAGLPAQPLHPGERIELAGVPVRAVGGRHAVIHPDIPLVGNVGLLVGTARADGGAGVLLHPGDSYDVEWLADAPAVDVLALPLSAPWAKASETIDFVRAVGPAVTVPVHDAMLQPFGRDLLLGHVGRLGRTRVLDLAGAGPTDPLAAGAE